MSRPIIQIAFADDHTIVRKGIADFINGMESGFNVYIQASEGEDLLNKIATADHLPDICIVDICMPIMDGYETMLQLRKKYPQIPALALTALDIDHEYPVLKMMKNGAGGYICKSADPQELEAALLELYTTGFYFSKETVKRFPKIDQGNMATYLKSLFTEQQTKFLSLCCSDLTYEQIGMEMNLSHRTAQNYAAIIGEKLNIHSRAALAMYALKAGIGHFNVPKNSFA